MCWNFLLQYKKTTKNPMIESIVAKFQTFRHRLFQLFPYRAGATMDLIDALSAMTTADSVVKMNLSDLFSRTYSSLTDVLNSLFRTNLKTPPIDEERHEQAFKVTQLLVERCAPSSSEKDYVSYLRSIVLPIRGSTRIRWMIAPMFMPPIMCQGKSPLL
jgi:hypothetical protein